MTEDRVMPGFEALTERFREEREARVRELEAKVKEAQEALEKEQG